jgi:hypothetical protein
LQLIPFIGTSLQRLFQNGISENDIISINQIVTEFSNDKLQLGLQDEVNKDSTNKHSGVINGSNSDSNNSSNRAEHWKSFIGSLRKLRNINSSIKEQQETLENTRKETIELSKQKQYLSSQCQTAVTFIGLVTKQIHHFNWLIDYYYNDVTKKIRASSPTSSPLLINLVYVNLGNHHKDDRAEEGKR